MWSSPLRKILRHTRTVLPRTLIDAKLFAQREEDQLSIPMHLPTCKLGGRIPRRTEAVSATSEIRGTMKMKGAEVELSNRVGADVAECTTGARWEEDGEVRRLGGTERES